MLNRIHNARIKTVVQYLEKHLDEEIDIKLLSSLCCYSEFHFHRVFRACIGESVYGYKKRLLLERAITQLLYSNASITEIAFNCGYENPSSFNKAFRLQFSMTPSAVRKQGVQQSQLIIESPPLRSIEMTPEITNINPIDVVCARATGAYAEAAPKAWETIMKFAYSNKLIGDDTRSIGICFDDPNVTSHDNLRYEACLDLDADVSTEADLSQTQISGGRYAIFLHKGAYEELTHSYNYIFNQWLPESGETLRDQQACFEEYLNRDPRKTKPENLRTKIYIPLN